LRKVVITIAAPGEKAPATLAFQRFENFFLPIKPLVHEHSASAPPHKLDGMSTFPIAPSPNLSSLPGPVYAVP